MIDQVTIVGGPKDKDLRQANIKLRFNRNPVIGGWRGQGGRCVQKKREHGGWLPPQQVFAPPSAWAGRGCAQGHVWRVQCSVMGCPNIACGAMIILIIPRTDCRPLGAA